MRKQLSSMDPTVGVGDNARQAIEVQDDPFGISF